MRDFLKRKSGRVKVSFVEGTGEEGPSEGEGSLPRGHMVFQTLNAAGNVITGEPNLFPTFSYTHQTQHKETENSFLSP